MGSNRAGVKKGGARKLTHAIRATLPHSCDGKGTRRVIGTLNAMKNRPLRFLLLILSFPLLSLCAMPQTKSEQKVDETAIQAVLNAQRDAWNRGDIEGYMDGYERSDATVFVSGDTVTHGWQTVLERYKKGYDSREKMGTLTFSALEITTLGKDSALVLGRWALQRAQDRPHGTFTLIFKRGKHGWKIIHDHTSAA
jgi:uncharacterized protein (TIGR02246 family)